jgi:hypothetical protein
MYGRKLKFTFFLGLLVSYMFILVACGDKGGDISILATSQSFVQTTSINNKVDILWDIDDSGSMADDQANLATNFNAFIHNFATQGYDFHMSVTTTTAWMREWYPNYAYMAKFRDGNIYTPTHADNTGIFMISTLTPDVIGTFQTNIQVGTVGSGDERGFDSFKQALINPDNTPYGFRRNDAFLAIVIVSDEEDFSRNSSPENQCVGNPLPAACQNLRSIASFESFLDTYTNSVPTDRKYNVSAITTRPGDSCLPYDGHYGLRYMQMAAETNGVVGSICDTNFSNSLDEIAGRIVELSTQFRLDRIPNVSTIVIHVNGVLIPENAVNGWTYNATNNSIVFHGSAVPPQGASIQVDYDPLTLG